MLLAYLLDVYFVAGRQEGKKGDRLQDGKGMMLEFAFSRGMEELCHPRRQGDITIARKRENLRIAVLCVVYMSLSVASMVAATTSCSGIFSSSYYYCPLSQLAAINDALQDYVSNSFFKNPAGRSMRNTRLNSSQRGAPPRRLSTTVGFQ